MHEIKRRVESWQPSWNAVQFGPAGTPLSPDLFVTLFIVRVMIAVRVLEKAPIVAAQCQILYSMRWCERIDKKIVYC